MGNDLTAGHSWDETTLGKRVDADNLNRAFSDATIKETAISARTAKDPVVLSDLLLISDGALKKATLQALATLLTANPDAAIITGRTEETAIADDDVFLVYDLSATALRKVTRANLGTFATRAEVTGVHTTGSVTAASTALTVASASGLTAGMAVEGLGIAVGTTIASIVGTAVTLSAAAGVTLSSAPVSFYINNKAITPASAGRGLCSAWVNFNGSGTVAINASHNVSSITDNGTGDYTVNFTTALPDENYALCGSAVGSQGTVNLAGFPTVTTKTSSACRIYVANNGGVYDATNVSVLFFR